MVHIGSAIDNYKLNFKPRIEKIKKILNMWQQRDLFSIGNVSIVNVLIMPILIAG